MNPNAHHYMRKRLMNLQFNIIKFIFWVVVILVFLACETNDSQPVQGQSDWVLQNLTVTPTPKLIKLTTIDLKGNDND